MSFLSLFSQDSGKVVLIFDVGSASVAGSLVYSEEDQKPQIIFSKRLAVPVSEIQNQNFQEIEPKMLNTLNSLSKAIQEKGLPLLSRKNRKIKNIFLFVSSPWVWSKVDRVEVEYQEEQIISSEYLQKILKDNEKKVLEKCCTEKEDNSLFSENNEVVEQRIIHTRLNGYETSNIFQPAKTIDFSVLVSISPESFIESLKKSILQNWGVEDVNINSFSLSFSEIIQDVFGGPKTSLAVSVTGEETEVFKVESGVIKDIASFPFGFNTLIRKISQKFEVSPEIARSFLQLYIDQAGDKVFLKSMKGLVDEVKQEWGQMLQEKVEFAKKGKSGVFRNVFLSTQTGSGDIFSNFLNEALWGDGTERSGSLAEDRGKVILMDQERLSHFVDLQKTESGFDSFISISAIFVSRLSSFYF